jgi:predicted nuclease with RNAse H fold
VCGSLPRRPRRPGELRSRAVLTSLGIDLAAQPQNTAACLIEWGLAGGEVCWVRTGTECSDDALVQWMTDASEVGIDAPFGWPATLVELLPEYRSTGRWPVAPRLAGGRMYYDRLRYRETDRAVNRLLVAERGVSLWPLSVSSDSIAVVAWRCAHLLHRYAERTHQAVDRLGETTRVFETYPAAALVSWELPRQHYKDRTAAKRKQAEHARLEILRRIERAGRSWLNLELTPWARQAFVASDHALDAFVSAVVARAAAKRHTSCPRPEQLALARSEGWIHVPRHEALKTLGPVG